MAADRNLRDCAASGSPAAAINSVGGSANSESSAAAAKVRAALTRQRAARSSFSITQASAAHASPAGGRASQAGRAVEATGSAGGRPDFTDRGKEGRGAARWDSRVKAIEPSDIVVTTGNTEERLKADRVYVMTGFAPSLDLLRETGVPIDPKTGIPSHDPNTLEPPVPGLFIAGVAVKVFDSHTVFIQHGRYNGDRKLSVSRCQRAP